MVQFYFDRVQNITGKGKNAGWLHFLLRSNVFKTSFQGSITLSQTTNLRLFQIERVSNFKFDINGTKFSKWVENTAAKGEIARYEQFLLFPQRFQNTFTVDK